MHIVYLCKSEGKPDIFGTVPVFSNTRNVFSKVCFLETYTFHVDFSYGQIMFIACKEYLYKERWKFYRLYVEKFNIDLNLWRLISIREKGRLNFSHIYRTRLTLQEQCIWNTFGLKPPSLKIPTSLSWFLIRWLNMAEKIT